MQLKIRSRVKVLVVIGGLLCVAALVFGVVQKSRDAFKQVRPRRVSAPGSPSSSSKLIRAGGNLQAELNAAAPGDTITLEAGAKFTGPFILPNKPGKGGETEWITIQSSQVSQLPVDVRVSPEKAVAMPKIIAGAGQPAIKTNGAAHHYKFIGIEIITNESGDAPYNLIELGDDGGSGQTTLDKVPHHFVFDRCYIHARDGQDAPRGFGLNSSDTEITNSYIANFKSKRTDSQTILAWNTPGRFKIINNYLEAATETLQFGGGGGCAPLTQQGILPSDIEVRRNRLTKRLEWRGVWLVKNLFEIKYARRVTVDGNLMENNWADGQVGFAVQLTVRNEGGVCNLNTIEDVTFTNNLVQHSSAAINLLGTDAPRQAGQGKRITIRNNLFFDLDSDKYGGASAFLQTIGADTVTVDHNTALFAIAIAIQNGQPTTRLTYTNNIASQGIIGCGGPGNDTIKNCLPGTSIKRNIFYNDSVHEPEYGNYPVDNWYPDTLAELGLINITGGDFKLANTSRYKGRATDGKDPGCDLDLLRTATAGTISGIWR